MRIESKLKEIKNNYLKFISEDIERDSLLAVILHKNITEL